jgi:hypothetical protein
MDRSISEDSDRLRLSAAQRVPDSTIAVQRNSQSNWVAALAVRWSLTFGPTIFV